LARHSDSTRSGARNECRRGKRETRNDKELIKVLAIPRIDTDSRADTTLVSMCCRLICLRRRDVTEVFFHCSDAEHVIVDRRGIAMDLREAREHAERLVHSFVMTANTEDWRNWVVHVTDDLGEELFALPFTYVLGQLH
jgi:hypothetical protein